MTAQEFRDMMSGKKPKRRKYLNEKVVVDGKKFDSIKEGNRYGTLRILEKAGHISDLKCQVPFALIADDKKLGDYFSDFTYLREGKLVVEDCKSTATRKISMYRWKKKHMLAQYGIEIKEV